MTYKHSKATREKIRKARLGKHHSPETREKIRQALLERGRLVKMGVLPAYHHSPATIRKLKKAAKGRKPTPQALKASAMVRGAASLDKRMARLIQQGKFEK